MWAAAAFAPASEEPTLSTATATPASAQSASASARCAPSPSDSRKRATERTPSERASAASQSLASSTAWLPLETRVWKRKPRRDPSALTATFPLCEIRATGPGSSGGAESPQSGARAWAEITPLPLGPQTGNRAASAVSRSSLCSSSPALLSANPAETTTAPPQPSSAASAITAVTPGAGIATTTASAGSGRSASDDTQG